MILYRCIQDKTHISISSHKSHNFKFEKRITNGEGNICKIKHVAVSVDDSEEKMIFLVKMTLNDRDTKPKLLTYLTSIQKTIAKVF